MLLELCLPGLLSSLVGLEQAVRALAVAVEKPHPTTENCWRRTARQSARSRKRRSASSAEQRSASSSLGRIPSLDATVEQVLNRRSSAAGVQRGETQDWGRRQGQPARRSGSGYLTAETIRYAIAAPTAKHQRSTAKGAQSRSALLVVAGKIVRSSLSSWPSNSLGWSHSASRPTTSSRKVSSGSAGGGGCYGDGEPVG